MVAAPKVSVCVLAYNHERYIEPCLRSILEQKTPFDFELVVGSDASPDGTASIVAEVAASDRRVRVVSHARNVGATQNFMATHNAAAGEYVAYLDGDDLAAPGKLAAQVAMLDASPQLAACGHRMVAIDKSGAPDGRHYPARLRGSFDIAKLIRCGMPVLMSSIMYRRAARKMRAAAGEIFDWSIVGDILEAGPCGYLPESLGFYRVGGGSITDVLGPKAMGESMSLQYLARLARWPERRADFFGYAVIAALVAIRRGNPISPPLAQLLKRSASIGGPFAAIDTLAWALQNRAFHKR